MIEINKNKKAIIGKGFGRFKSTHTSFF